jgi:hypothetical protein
MKGFVFGGVLYMPDHPAADIHGLVRGCIRTRTWLQAEELLTARGIQRTHALWSLGFWRQSQSAVEILISQQHYGELLVCPLVEAYLNAAHYKPYKPSQENRSVPTGFHPSRSLQNAK